MFVWYKFVSCLFNFIYVDQIIISNLIKQSKQVIKIVKFETQILNHMITWRGLRNIGMSIFWERYLVIFIENFFLRRIYSNVQYTIVKLFPSNN